MWAARPARGAQHWIALLGAPASRRAYQASAIALTCIGLGLAALYTRQQSSPTFPVDDAYIVSHNAELLFSRAPDTHFVGTPALAGATSAVHLVLVSSLALLLPVLWAQWSVMILGALAYALATLRLGFVLGVSILEMWGLVALSVLVAQTPHQLANGLETSWALAALTLAIATAHGEQGAHHAKEARDAKGARAPRWLLPALCGVLPFLRPELAAVSALLLVQRAQRDWRSQGPRSVLRAVGIAALAALPWLALYWAALGAPFPNTIAAKRNFFADACAPSSQRWDALEAALFQFQGDVGALFWIACLLPLTALGRAGLVFGVVFGAAYHAGGPHLLQQNEQRYLYLLLPWLSYGLGIALRVQRRWARLAGALFLLFCLIQSAAEQPKHWSAHQALLSFTRTELEPVASWLNEHARGRKILLHDAGYVGYAVHAPLVDMVGLKTPASLAPHRELTFPQCSRAARQRAIASIAQREQPQLLVVLDAWDELFGISDALREHGWQLEPRYRGGAYRVLELRGAHLTR